MRYVASNIARKVGKIHGWRGRFWERRYQAIVVTDEERAQVARLRYLLAHGVKEGLVSHPAEWPGMQCVTELIKGRSAVHGGLWKDETGLRRARESSGRRVREHDFIEKHSIKLSPLPCWRGLSGALRASALRELVEEIVSGHAQTSSGEASKVLGVRSVLAQNPEHRPDQPKRGVAPAFHAATRGAFRELTEAYRLFVAAYRSAADALKEANLEFAFPDGCFPPPVPRPTEAATS